MKKTEKNINIINPNFKLLDDNIFNIREKEYNSLMDKIRKIVDPVKEIGFEVLNLELKNSNFSSGELSKTVKQTLVMKFQKEQYELDLSIAIPKLIDNNYYMINGRKKIPLFQLFDIPLVTRGKFIKLRTNVMTSMIIENKQPPFVSMTFMSKKAPLSLFMFAYYEREELNNMFNFENVEILEDTDEYDNVYDRFIYDMKCLYDVSENDTRDDFILELGKKYTKYNSRTKGEDIIHGLKLVPEIDFISKEFFFTGSVLEELIYGMKHRHEIDDLDFINKRMRCVEYVILNSVMKIIYDMCIICRTIKKPKFNTNSMQILTQCNVSDIVQFDFSINPVEELTKLSRISLLGPGGFKRDNVPSHLRGIHESMFGRVCPVDTPDRENCGILQNLIPNVKVDNNYRFSNQILEKQIISIPVSLTPFVQNDDQTRLQMSSSQMRQSIMLNKFDKPYVESGCEGLYTDYTHSVKKAKYDGSVVFLDDKFIIVKYDNGESEIFNIELRKIYVKHLDMMNIYVSQGDKFKAGDILAESNFCKNGNINIGRNLKTAIMSYYGYNYEDGIIISDRLVKEKILTSTHFIDLSFNIPENMVLLSLSKDKYKPLPDKLERLELGDSYAILKELNSMNHTSIFKESENKICKKNLIITDINIYANTWNEEIPQYNEWVKKQISKQERKENHLQETIIDVLGKDVGTQFIKDNHLDKFSYTGKYKFKKEKIEGIKVEIFGIYSSNIKIGDKIANRHGNKGIISKIQEHDKMPQFEDGSHADIIINPMGIIGRMNIGQLYELHMGASFVDLKNNTLKMLENKTQEEIKKYLLDYIKIIDNTENNWYFNQFENQIKDMIIDEELLNNLSVIAPPFESTNIDMLKDAMIYTNTKFKQNIFDPISNQQIINEVASGYLYFYRIVHIAEDKLTARGVAAYSRRTMQPLKSGKNSKNGQRLGEMETACLIGYDAPINLHEFLTTKSDCMDLKNQYIKKMVKNELDIFEEPCDNRPETVKLLNAYFKVLGLDTE